MIRKLETPGMKTTAVAVAAALGMFALANSASAANILVNGGFETQGGGDATTAANWNFAPGGGIAPTTATRDTNQPRTGSNDLHLIVTGSASAAGPASNAQSTFDPGGAATITPGTNYNLQFYTTGTFGPGAVLNTFIDFYDAGGALLPGGRILKEGGYATSSAGYNLHNVSQVAPANAAFYSVFFNFVTGAFDGASGNISIDDVSFNDPTAIPEPASLSVLALGAVGLLARRRR